MVNRSSLTRSFAYSPTGGCRFALGKSFFSPALPARIVSSCGPTGPHRTWEGKLTKNLSRRDLLKGLAIGSVTVASAGALASCAPQEKGDAGKAGAAQGTGQLTYAKRKSDVASMSQTETDVLVIGGGGRGPLRQALSSASEQGARVVLCREDRACFGGAYHACPAARSPPWAPSSRPKRGEARQHRRLRHGHHPPQQLQRAPRPRVHRRRELQRHRRVDRGPRRWSGPSTRRLYYGQTAHRMHTAADGAGAGLAEPAASRSMGDRPAASTQML